MTKSTAPIKAFAIGIYDGPHATPEPSDDGPIFLGIKNVTEDGRLDFSEIRHVSEKEFPKWTRRVTPQRNDIVFSYEATLHRYARIPDGFVGCLGRRMALIRPDVEKVEPRFLHYFLLSPGWRAKMDAITINGATVNRIPLTSFPDTIVSFPGLNEQTAVADVLSAYDDLIENNRRRIALLEHAAQMFYREWFANLRFPGHEHVKIIDGTPQGWERRRLGSILTLKRGYDLPEAKRVAGSFPIVSSSGITGFHTDHKAVGPGVVTGRYGTLGQVYYVEGGYWPLNTALYVKDFQGSHPLMVFHLLKALLKGIIAEKAAVPGLDRNVLHAMLITWPPENLRNLFVEVVVDHQNQVRVLEAMNEKLTQARDLLLPRLMSGEMPV
ncbi:type I restriction enzyme S subunit [Bradyrhizobium sp. USDA 3311]